MKQKAKQTETATVQLKSFPVELLRQAKAKAANDGVTLTALVAKAVSEHCNRVVIEE